MKKYIFLLGFLVCFLFLPKNALAKSYNVQPNWAKALANDKLIFDGNPQGWSLYNNNYYTFTVEPESTTISNVNWIYENKWPLELDKNYDVSFKIYQPNVAVSSLEGFNAGKPIVSIENKACWVDYASTNTGSSNVYAASFNVICENVNLSSKTFRVYVDTAPFGTKQTLHGWRYGIAQSFDITLSNDNSNLQASIDKNTQTQEEIKDSITNSDTTESEDKMNGFFEGFEDNNHGLSSIITAPLEFIRNLLGHSCEPLTFELPFVEKSVSLPCIKPIYQKYFGPFFNLWQVLTTGLIAYSVGIRIFATVKGLQDPQNDKIEVLKL